MEFTASPGYSKYHPGQGSTERLNGGGGGGGDIISFTAIVFTLFSQRPLKCNQETTRFSKVLPKQHLSPLIQMEKKNPAHSCQAFPTQRSAGPCDTSPSQ